MLYFADFELALTILFSILVLVVLGCYSVILYYLIKIVWGILNGPSTR